MMQEGRVVHIEDDSSWRDIAERQLEGTNHQLVGSATTMSEADAILEQMAAGEVNANVVLLDGNLGDGFRCDDARQIRKKIRDLGLAVRIIGFSGSDDLRDLGIEVDDSLLKSSYELGTLAAAIDGLKEPESPVATI